MFVPILFVWIVSLICKNLDIFNGTVKTTVLNLWFLNFDIKCKKTLL